MKRFFDIVVSLSALVVLAPVMAIIAVLIRQKLGSPVLFKQRRAGLNGAVFEIRKFRTMMDAVDENGKALSDEQRMTSFGLKLRVTSIDELPTLFGVLSGDMSLVGPRPLLPAYLPLYNEEQARRHLVKPGITGWAQVNGRNALSWEEKFKLDVWYVDNQSFWLDCRILAKTVATVVKKEGIQWDSKVISYPFTGTPKNQP